MKKYLGIIILLNFISCSVYESKIKKLSSNIEIESKIHYHLKSKVNDLSDIAKTRNIALRTQIFINHKNEIIKSKKIYLIESYEYNWGVNLSNYIVINSNIYTYLKDDFLLKLTSDDGEVPRFILNIKDKLDKNEIDSLEKNSRYSENKICDVIYKISIINAKKISLIKNFEINCFEEDENGNLK